MAAALLFSFQSSQPAELIAQQLARNAGREGGGDLRRKLHGRKAKSIQGKSNYFSYQRKEIRLVAEQKNCSLSLRSLDACASPLLFVHHKARGIKKRKRTVGPCCWSPQREGGVRPPPWTPLCSRLSQAVAMNLGPVPREKGEASPPIRCLTAARQPSGAACPLGSHFLVQSQRSQRFRGSQRK